MRGNHGNHRRNAIAVELRSQLFVPREDAETERRGAAQTDVDGMGSSQAEHRPLIVDRDPGPQCQKGYRSIHGPGVDVEIAKFLRDPPR